MRVVACLLTALVVNLGGCANYEVVTNFAQATRQVAAPVRDEMTFIRATCVQQAGLRGGFELDAEFKRITECLGTDQVVQALLGETVDVMDLYASALLALADADKKLDISADIEATTQKLAAIKTKSGASPITEAQAGALSKILSLIAEVWIRKERDEGIKILVDASPELAGVARTLSSFFKKTSGTGDAPYVQLAKLTQAEAGAVNAALRSDFVLKVEPIRAAELRLEQWKVNQALAGRADAGPSGVGAMMARSLDAWVESIPVFREQALKKDPEALLRTIIELRAKAAEARAAAKAAF